MILAINKVDLFPYGTKPQRIREWVHREMRAIGLVFSFIVVKRIQNFKELILLSGETGEGCKELVEKAAELCRGEDASIYLVGTANVGKSTLINKLIKTNLVFSSGKGLKPIFDPNTVSILPGTTLGLVPFALNHRYSRKAITKFYDSPGVLVKNHIWNKLYPQELNALLPSKQIRPNTYRIAENHSVVLGTFAAVTLAEGRPFYFTIFSSPEVIHHITEESRILSVIEKHGGGLLTPLFEADRVKEFPLVESYSFDVTGEGWMRASYDLVFPGLGWISFTGVGSIKISTLSVKGLVPILRPSIMPFEAHSSMRKYHGLGTL